ncbi:MAG TPA: hypothetical protein VG204_09315 [Terriglobia bacterium]|nr:hypothetical protein [Terriglobia bacterium]
MKNTGSPPAAAATGVPAIDQQKLEDHNALEQHVAGEQSHKQGMAQQVANVHTSRAPMSVLNCGRA